MAGGDSKQVEHILAAVAAAWALDMKPAFIRAGIENLRTPLQVPTDDAGRHDVQEGIKRQRFRIERITPGELLMKVSRIRALRGPNLWSRQTAIEAVVSCSTGYPAGVLPDFLDRLRGRFPQINLP